MNKENKMYDYLLEHNYISKNENKNPLRQQELSKERAKCIANKYNNLIKELQQEKQQLKERINKAIEYINSSCYCPEFNKHYLDNLLEILKGEEND